MSRFKKDEVITLVDAAYLDADKGATARVVGNHPERNWVKVEWLDDKSNRQCDGHYSESLFELAASVPPKPGDVAVAEVKTVTREEVAYPEFPHGSIVRDDLGRVYLRTTSGAQVWSRIGNFNFEGPFVLSDKLSWPVTLVRYGGDHD